MKKQVELLVPAGGKEQFMAAVQNGADAIYIGGKMFNARAGAMNFDDDEMQLAIDYAHRYGVKVFVTMNTLLSDDELFPALKYATFLYKAGVDALIVQDLGFGKMVNECMPDFELHLSTQATITDVSGALAAGKLGYSRVVLARELSLQEISEIAKAGNYEIEVFVHGAICICYSGQCQYSRYYGGRSGNRGSCAQPCRLKYQRIDNLGNKISGYSHQISPKDMCLVDYLGSLIDAGVSSFKIEGRMKSAEYVAIVTSIYRKYIDMYIKKGFLEVEERDRLELLQIFNRGEFTDAYIKGKSGSQLMSGDIAKNQGVEAGKVVGVKKGSTLIDVEVEKEISIGDGIEIYGRSSKLKGSTTISYIKKIEKNVIRLGDVKSKVNVGDLVYRTSKKSQIEKAKDSFKGASFIPEEDLLRTKRRRPISMEVFTREKDGKGFVILKAATIETPSTIGWISMEPQISEFELGPFDIDFQNPTSIKKYENSLRKIGNTPFELISLEFKNDFNLRLKTSDINYLRRECLDILIDKLKFRRTAHVNIDNYRNIVKKNDNKDYFEIYFNDIKDYLEMRASGIIRNISDKINKKYGKNIKILLPMAGIISENLYKLDDNIIPYIGGVTRGKEEQILRDNYEYVIKISMKNSIYIGNLGWIYDLSGKDIKIIADFGLNIYNSKSVEVLESLGADDFRWSLEAADKIQGRYPLMVTEHRFKSGHLKSKGTQDINIVNPSYGSQSLILPNKELNNLIFQVEECASKGKSRFYI